MDNLTRTRQERILALDRQLRLGKYPNCSSFAKYWQERFGYERRLDRRTIMRDLAYLRDMHRAPVEFDGKRNGFYYTDPSWPLPSLLTVSQPEMLNLLLAWRAMALYRETPLEETLGGLFGKLSSAIADEVDLQDGRLESKFSFYASSARPIDPEIWKTVFEALRLRHVVEILYCRPNDKAPAYRQILPLHLANIDGEWYITAFCLKRDDYRHFALSRIRAAIRLEEEFETPADFDPTAYYANRFAKFLGPSDSKPLRVKVRFTPEATPWVLERTWHPQQEVIREKDGGLILTLPMPSIVEAKRWILGWGAAVEVMSPRILRVELSREISVMKQRYSQRKL